MINPQYQLNFPDEERVVACLELNGFPREIAVRLVEILKSVPVNLEETLPTIR